MKRRDLLLGAGLSPLLPGGLVEAGLSRPSPTSPEPGPAGTASLVAIAEGLKPTLRETIQLPQSLVRPVAAPAEPLRWRIEPEGPADGLAGRVLKKGDVFTLDFGGHRTGYLSFRLTGVGRGVDAPVRLRFTFGEVPTDVAEPFYPYKGGLSSAWLPDEIVNVDFLPQDVRLPRRYAFRFVKVEIVDVSPNFGVRFENVRAHAVTSAEAALPPLPPGVPDDLRRIDEVAAATLRDCMQTTFEDGPRRDQRLWTGDLRVQALTNYATFNNAALVKRSLYLLAAFPREDGSIPACVFEKPMPFQGHEYIADYAVLFGVTVLEYVRATGDLAAGRELWPTVKRQMELVGRYVNADGLFADPGGVWIFIDWNDALDRTASMHGVLLYGYRQTLELARLLGLEGEVAASPCRSNCPDDRGGSIRVLRLRAQGLRERSQAAGLDGFAGLARHRGRAFEGGGGHGALRRPEDARRRPRAHAVPQPLRGRRHAALWPAAGGARAGALLLGGNGRRGRRYLLGGLRSRRSAALAVRRSPHQQLLPRLELHAFVLHTESRPGLSAGRGRLRPAGDFGNPGRVSRVPGTWRSPTR